jgi:hypothetical protein
MGKEVKGLCHVTTVTKIVCGIVLILMNLRDHIRKYCI